LAVHLIRGELLRGGVQILLILREHMHGHEIGAFAASITLRSAIGRRTPRTTSTHVRFNSAGVSVRGFVVVSGTRSCRRAPCDHCIVCVIDGAVLRDGANCASRRRRHAQMFGAAAASTRRRRH